MSADLRTPLPTGCWAALAALLAGAGIAPTPAAAETAIERVTVASESQRQVDFEILYAYDGERGADVFLSVRMAQDGQVSPHYAYRPERLRRGRHRARVTLGVREQAPAVFSTNQIRVGMYVGGGESFLERDFAFWKTWSETSGALEPSPAILVRAEVATAVTALEPPQLHRVGDEPGQDAGCAEPVRRVLPNGHVQLDYPDGTVIERFEGGYAVTRPDGSTQTVLFASAQPPTPPSAPPDDTHAAWIEGENQRLLAIIRTLVGDDQPSVDYYLSQEGPEMSPYARVYARTQAIDWLVRP